MELLRALLRHRVPHDGVLWAQHVLERKVKSPLTAISAACFRGQEAFDLPIFRDVELDVSKQHFNALFSSECNHMPIFMAVQNLVMTGDTATVRRCVAAGTDMNKSARSYSESTIDSGPPKWRLDYLEDLHRYMTPLVMLLS